MKLLDNLISDMSFEKSAADAKARIKHLERVIRMLADENKRLKVKGKWIVDAKMRIKLFKEKYPGVILKIIQKGEVVDG